VTSALTAKPSPRISLVLDFLLDADAPLTDSELDYIENSPQPLEVNTKFLAHNSNMGLGSYLLSQHAEAANLRAELEDFLSNPRVARDVRRALKAKHQSPNAYRFDIVDAISSRLATIKITRWVLDGGLEKLVQAVLDGPPSPNAVAEVMAQVRERLRNHGRSQEEIAALAEWRQQVKENPGAAHRSAVLAYAQRHIEKGTCERCPQPLDPGSVRYCEKHLTACRERMKRKAAARNRAPHGRAPGTAAALALWREQRSQGILAEMGIPREDAAIGVKAAKAALLSKMPDSEARAMSARELFDAAIVPNPDTGRHALRELLFAGTIHRIGAGTKGSLFRFFTNGSNT
jgi:hypothetical protein